MANKKYKLTFVLSDGSEQSVEFEAPQGPEGSVGVQGPQGEKGDTGATGPKGDIGLTGVAGKDGYTPIKGTDYFTQVDKEEMVAAVIAALPDASEVNY